MTDWRVVSLVALATLTLPGCTSGPDRPPEPAPDRLVAEAAECLTRRPPDRDGARRRLEQAVALDADHAEAWCRLGNLELEPDGDADAATRALERCTRLRPADARALVQLGEARLRLGKLDAAAPAFHAALALDARLAAAHAGLAEVAAAGDDPCAARTALARALEIDPDALAYHYRYGLAARRCGDRADAERHLEIHRLALELERVRARGERDPAVAAGLLERLLALEPRSPRFRAELSRACQLAGRLEDAAQLWRQALVTLGPEPRYRARLVLLLLEAGRTAEALAEVSTLSTGDGADALVALAAAAGARQENRRERDLLRAALEAEPGHPEACSRLADCQLRLGDPAAAAAQLAVCVEHEPKEAVLRNNYGMVLRAAGRGPEAETELGHAAALAPFWAAPRSNLALVLAARGDLDGAQRALEEAVLLDPSFLEGHLNLGQLHLRRGQARRAIESLEHARLIAPRDPRPLEWLARAHESLGELAEAGAARERAGRLAGPPR